MMKTGWQKKNPPKEISFKSRVEVGAWNWTTEDNKGVHLLSYF